MKNKKGLENIKIFDFDGDMENVAYREAQIRIPKETIMLNVDVVYKDEDCLNHTNITYDTDEVKELIKQNEDYGQKRIGVVDKYGVFYLRIKNRIIRLLIILVKNTLKANYVMIFV